MKRVMKVASIVMAVMALTAASTTQAEARRGYARGANGAVGGFARQGQYGSSVGGRAVRYGSGGAGFRAGSFAGPNGGTFQGANAGAFKKGIGGARASKFSSQGPNGGSASGYSNNVYNAQTGSGTRNSGKDINTASGQSYGYDGSTSYTKGSGATSTIDTQNKGDYTVDWQKGAKPVVTPVPSSP
ncbi:hypothetical protein KBI23_00630 [bacterium]|nr:hypothetical protein [bacterium]MBP9809057.1 hypothetical protein [bacterium]